MSKFKYFNILFFAALVSFQISIVSLFAQEKPITRAETLRGSITPEREWWDLRHYDLSVEFFPDTKTIKGSNVISFKTVKSDYVMQIDLQEPLAITKATHQNKELKYKREGNAYFIYLEEELPKDTEDSITVYWEGRPTESRNPPWSGGITWGRDDLGEHFITTTCQGIGASIWWANKDHGADEPDKGMNINITVPENLAAVSNGRLKKIDENKAGKTKTFRWQITNPINNYAVNANIGNYVHWEDKYKGEGGELDLQYWVLPHQKEVAMKQFQEVPRMLKAFEHWFGKYPWYEDGYKLVTVSYAGMEHQSSVTYGNWFRNGYRARDYSNSGIGWKFDFIIVHESGHEWFGNNISMKDAADMWIHEGFTNYSESLFVDYWFGKKEAGEYVVGSRLNIRNDKPIIGTYNSNREGSGDMYAKGGSLLHTIRNIINDDEKWRGILRGLNKDFRHQTVTTAQVENYISRKSGMDFSKVFDQYLRTAKIPKLQYKTDGKTVSYQWTNVVSGFAMPVRVAINGKEVLLKPTETGQKLTADSDINSFEIDRNFYVETEKSN